MHLKGDQFLQLALVDSVTNQERCDAVVHRLEQAADQLLLLENGRNDVWKTCVELPLSDVSGVLFGRFSLLSRVQSFDLGPGCLVFTVTLNGTAYFAGRDMAGELALMLHEAACLVRSGVRHHVYADESGVPMAVLHWDEGV